MSYITPGRSEPKDQAFNVIYSALTERPDRNAQYKMSHLFDSLHNAVSRARGHAGSDENDETKNHFIDVTIKFIGASGLPKMDVVGSADPYFVAKLDDRLSFV